MKRLNALFLILISVSLFSCREEQYIDEMIYNIKNNTIHNSIIISQIAQNTSLSFCFAIFRKQNQ